MTTARHLLLLLLFGLLAVGCPPTGDDDDSASDDDDATGDDDDATGDDDDATGDDDDSAALPDTYTFPSRFEAGQDSVSYSGQVVRHVLIHDLKGHIGGMTDRLNGTGGAPWFPVQGEVEDEILFYFAFDSETSGSIPHGVDTTPAPSQTTYDDVSSGKDLVGKLAGNDPTGQHRDWSTEFAGWGATGSTTPEDLLMSWFAELDAAAIAWSGGTIPTDPQGNPVSDVFVTAQGHDLQQLIQKFLDAAVGFSQGADDYLDDDIDGKGLKADNTVADDIGKPYSALEHAWDEGFGYFGATRNYGDWTDQQLADEDAQDANGDGAIDLTTEWVKGHAVNAGKRDLGAVVATDFTQQAWDAFLTGRAIITNADGALSDEDAGKLGEQRDLALDAWEKAIAATVVHYINDLLQDIGTYPNEDFGDVAKHWSEMKGFALAFQFNRRSPMLGEFETLHDLLGDAPVLSSALQADIDQYTADLRTARGLLHTAYGFDAANMGDDDGLNGW